jgi:hypothetical protein
MWHHVAMLAAKQHRSAKLKLRCRETVGNRHVEKPSPSPYMQAYLRAMELAASDKNG